MILRQETIDKFGYDPFDLPPKSNLSIIIMYPNCQEIREYRKQNYHPDLLCRRCNGSKVGTVTGGKRPRKYFTEAEIKEANRSYQRKTNLTRWHTPKGVIINRLATSLRQALKGQRNGTFRLLGYRPGEIVAHIQGQLERYNYICPMCKNADLHHTYLV